MAKLHKVTTDGQTLAVTTDENEAVSTVNTYHQAGMRELDIVHEQADDQADD